MSYKYAEKLNAYDASSIYTRSKLYLYFTKLLNVVLLTETWFRTIIYRLTAILTIYNNGCNA